MITVTITQTEPMLTVEPLRADVSPNDACVTEWRRLNIVAITGPRTKLFDILDWLERSVSSGQYEFDGYALPPDAEAGAHRAFVKMLDSPAERTLIAMAAKTPGARVCGLPVYSRIVWTDASDEDAVLCRMKWHAS